MRLDNKNFIISGSSKGIGLSIARSFIDAGAKVLINSRNNEELKLIASENKKMISFSGDLSQSNVADNLVAFALKEWGKIDGIICNIGFGGFPSPGQESLKDWQRAFEINLYTTTNLVQAATPALEISKGTIVCISSICGHEALGAPLPYSSAKAALNSFIKGEAKVLGAKGIRINGISPGHILFPGSVWERKLKEDKAIVEDILNKAVALKRFGTPQEIANLALFLSSDLSSYCTGSILVADGGLLRS